MKILFAEDDAVQLEVGGEILSHSKGCQVQLAANGREALEMLKTFPADVLITDNQMPFMEGPELIRRAKVINPAIRTVLTGGSSNIPELARGCGSDEAVPKPFLWEDMIALIKKWET